MDYIFETEHLRFRKFTRKDAISLYQNHLEKSLKKWMPNECYISTEEAENAAVFFENCVEKSILPFVLAIECKIDNILIGDTGINEAPGGVEIGYTICEAYQGRGYATEALNALTKYANERFGITTLFGRVLKGNDVSCHVMKKAHYTYLREEKDAEDDPYGNGMLVYVKEILSINE